MEMAKQTLIVTFRVFPLFCFIRETIRFVLFLIDESDHWESSWKGRQACVQSSIFQVVLIRFISLSLFWYQSLLVSF